MVVAAAEEFSELEFDKKLAWIEGLRALETGVDWWGVSMLELSPKSIEFRVRAHMEGGHPERVLHQDRRLEVWADLRKRAEEFSQDNDLREWRSLAWKDSDGPEAKRLRHAALQSERAFAIICNLNDKGKPWNFATFHVLVARAMRQSSTAAIFMPLEHGKSAANSILVPLMDWAEWPDATSCRVYWNQSNMLKWISTLMGYVERSEEIHQVFPWIRRPGPGDQSQFWSTEGFSIGGSHISQRSFEVLTARGFSTGNRYSRIGADDWVNSGNARSTTVQDGLEEYWLSGPSTFVEYNDRPSEYGTMWGTAFYCGTFFDRRDVGYRFYNWCLENDFPALKYDVYPLGARYPNIVLWPDGRPPDYIDLMKRKLRSMFNKRMRNMVVDDGQQTFTDVDVNLACKDEYHYGEVPAGARATLSFDPASGKTTKYTADPALVLYAEVDDGPPPPQWGQLPDLSEQSNRGPVPYTAHFVWWKRLIGFDFVKQCGEIITQARHYHLPVIIESNTLQKAYKDYINKMAPDVKVTLRHTHDDVVDPDNGIESMSPLFAEQRAVIHTAGAPEDEVHALITQFVEWPQVRRKDLLMAFWFAHFQLSLKKRRQTGPPKLSVQVPSYMQGQLWRYGGKR